MATAFVCLACYGLGWIMGFVTCSLSGAVSEEAKKLSLQKAKVDALRPPTND